MVFTCITTDSALKLRQTPVLHYDKLSTYTTTDSPHKLRQTPHLHCVRLTNYTTTGSSVTQEETPHLCYDRLPTLTHTHTHTATDSPHYDRLPSSETRMTDKDRAREDRSPRKHKTKLNTKHFQKNDRPKPTTRQTDFQKITTTPPYHTTNENPTITERERALSNLSKTHWLPRAMVARLSKPADENK